jgi:transposase
MRKLKIQKPEMAISALQHEIRRSEESRYDHRLHGVLLVAHGLSARQAAELLGDAPRTVELWVHRFQEANLAGLHEEQRPGRPSRVSPEQSALAQMAIRSMPAEAGLKGERWDAITLSDYLSSLGVSLKPRQCRNLLRQWGFRER